MANAIIGALRVSLGLDSAEFSKGLSGAQSKLSDFDKRMRNIGGKIAAVGAAISVAGAGIALAVRGQLDAADEMSKASQKFGVPIETLSKLKYAADLSDVSLETLGKSFGRLSKDMVAAGGGNKAAAEKFADIGVAVKDATGKIRPSEAVMSDIADVMAKMPDGAEKTALALNLFGKSGAELIPLLNGGGAAMREMMAEADALGLTISEKTGKDAEAFNDNLTRLQMAFRGLATEITAALLPAMLTLSEWAVNLAKWFGDLSPTIQQFIAVLSGIVVVMGPMLVLLGGAVAAIGSLTTAVVALGAAALENPILLLITAVAAGAVLIYANWDSLVSFFEDTWTRISAGLTYIAKMAEGAAYRLKAAFFSAIRGIAGAFVELTWTIADGLNTLFQTDTFTGMSAEVTQSLAQMEMAADGMATSAQAAAQTAADAFNAPRQAMDDTTEAVTTAGAAMADSLDTAAASASNLGDQLGGGGGGGKKKKTSVATGLDKVNQSMSQFRSSAEGAFTGLITGAMSFNEALGQVLDSLAQMLAKAAFANLFGDGSGSLGALGNLFFNANGTPSSPGGLTMVGERGPELVNMPRGAQVFSAPETKAMLGAGQGVSLHFAIDARYATEGTAEMIARTLQAKTPEIVRQAVASVGAAKRRGLPV